MKAWKVGIKDDFYSEIVFAETRGKAKVEALTTDCCNGADFMDIEVRRVPEADQYYKDGKWHLDWMDDEDRLILVKEFGYSCEYIDLDWCRECAAKEYCDEYQDYLESEAQENEQMQQL